MNSQNNTFKRHIYLRVNDIFDELKTENRRLSNELIFANKSLIRLKRFLAKIHEKYNQFIDNEDKQEVIELKNILENVNENLDPNFDFNQMFRNCVKKELTIERSNQLIKEKILRKYKNQSLKKVIKSETNSGQLSDNEWDQREDQSSDDSEDNVDEETKLLRQKYIKKDNIFDPNTNLFKCPKSECNKAFKVTESLYQHLRVVHKMPKIKDKNYGFIKSLNCFDCNTNTYKCPKPDCNKQFATKSRIYRHLTIVHSNKPKLVCKEPNCGKLLKNNNNLRLHMKTHSLIPEPKPFLCEQMGCQYRCKTKHELNQHLRSHSNERPFKCSVPECDKSFKNARGLKDHSFTHYSEPSLQCQFEGCQLFFQTVWHRKNHMNVVHYGKNSNDRPLKPCDWPGCDYTTRFAHQIKKHKRLHTGEKPYPCDWPACGKRFRLIQQLKDHKNIHNNVKPYVCHWPGCHYRCSDSANLRKHVRTSHNTIHSKVTEQAFNFLRATTVCEQQLIIPQ